MRGSDAAGLRPAVLEFADPATRLRAFEAGVARTDDVLLILDLATFPGRIVFANQAFERVSGWSCSEAVGRTPEFLRGPGTDPSHLARIAQDLQQNRTVRCELGGSRRDGSELLVEIEIVPLAEALQPGLCIALARDITERHRHETARQRLADLLQTSQQLADVGGWELDLDSGHLFWTRQTYLLMGVDPATYVPTLDRALAFYLPESRERLMAAMAAMIELGERLDVEAEIVTAQGEHRHVRINNDVVRANGRVVKVYGAVQDISERVRASAELRASEQRWKFALEGSGDAAWDWDLASDRVARSASWAQLFGYPPDEVPAELGDWQARIHPEDRAQVQAALGQHLAGTTPHLVVETRMRREDASWMWVKIRGIVTERTADGAPMRMIGTLSDISARKYGERDLEISRRRLQQIFSAMAEGLVVQDSAGVILDCNLAAERILGIAADDLRGRTSLDPWGDAIREDGMRFHESQHPAMLTLVTESPQRDVVMGIRGRDGQRQWLSINTTIASDPLTGAPMVVSSFGDITARKALEHQLEERNLLLQRRTSEAQALARAKSTFLANMSHEMRTPLAAILGLAEQALAPDAAAPGWREALLGVRRSAAHMLEIVNDVLDATRLDSGQLPLCPSPVDVLHLCREVCELLLPGAQAKSIAVRREINWPLPMTIQVDRLRLKQVLLNLVSNAIKFTDRGSVCISLAASREEGLRIDVSDTGIGIAPDLIEDLFRPFVQGESSNSRRFGGTGLGLYISRELALRMGGSLAASSAPGEGSRFSLTLPLDPVVRWTQTETPAHDGDEFERPLPALRGTVLLAEDDPTLRELFARMLRRIGLAVLTAEDGSEAVHLALNRDVDLILMDMHMPMIDGRAATRRLRNLGRNLPIVAITADMLPESVAGHLQAGCNGVLGKPASLEELHGILSAWLARDMQSAIVAEAEARLAGVRARFLLRLREDWTALQADLRARRFVAVRERLHRIKGAAGMFGLTALQARSATAEAAAAGSHVDGALVLAAIQALAPEIEALLQGQP